MEALPVMRASAQVNNNTNSISNEACNCALKGELHSLGPFSAIISKEGIK